MFCHKKGGHFQTGEQEWVPLFPVSKGAMTMSGMPETCRMLL